MIFKPHIVHFPRKCIRSYPEHELSETGSRDHFIWRNVTHRRLDTTNYISVYTILYYV